MRFCQAIYSNALTTNNSLHSFDFTTNFAFSLNILNMLYHLASYDDDVVGGGGDQASKWASKLRREHIGDVLFLSHSHKI